MRVPSGRYRVDFRSDCHPLASKRPSAAHSPDRIASASTPLWARTRTRVQEVIRWLFDTGIVKYLSLDECVCDLGVGMAKQTWMVISISRPSRSQHHLSQTVTKYLFQSSLYEGWLNPFNFSRLALALSWTKSFPTGYEQISIQFSHKLTQHIIPNKSPIDLTKLSEASQRKLPNDWNSIPSN